VKGRDFDYSEPVTELLNSEVYENALLSFLNIITL